MLPLPGTAKQYQQLSALMAKESFVAVVAGPPGSGKRTLLDHVAKELGLHMSDFDIEKPGSSEAELRKLIAMQLTACQFELGGIPRPFAT